MQLTVRGRHTPPSHQQETHALRRFERISRYLAGEHPASLVLDHQRGLHIAEMNVETDGLFVRSSARGGDGLAVIDDVMERVEKQILRYRQRRAQNRHRTDTAEAVETTDTEAPLPHIVRRKRYSIKPMLPDEAIQQMELLDHTFFLFVNAATGHTNVVYRREDGNYGHIEPEA
jgi:putative sigma-54 modulation protein